MVLHHPDAAASSHLHHTLTKPHALIFPWPAQGHIVPTLLLAKKLAASGFCITFVNTEYNQARLITTTLPSQAFGIRFLSIPDGLPPEHSRTGNIMDLCRAMDNMGDAFEELIEKLRHVEGQHPVTCIISDVFALFTQNVANKLGIPRVAFWTQSAANYIADLIVSKGYRPPMETTGVRSYNTDYLITCIPGTPPVTLRDLNTGLHSLDPSDYGFSFIVEPFQRLKEATSILINSFDELESDALHAIRKEHDVHVVGPLLLLSSTDSSKCDAMGLWPAEHDCLSWLDRRAASSVLYVSFGSISVLSRRDVEELALGLEASEQSFLWVIRPDLMSGSPAIFPAGFKERVRNRAMFISWAPQLQVLSHPSIGGFLTHCGWNSMLESISTGVPMIGRPYFADQMLNQKCMVHLWKIGLGLDAGKDGLISRSEVELKVRSIMIGNEGQKIRTRIKNFKGAAKRAVEKGGSSYNDFQRFVRTATVNQGSK